MLMTDYGVDRNLVHAHIADKNIRIIMLQTRELPYGFV